MLLYNASEVKNCAIIIIIIYSVYQGGSNIFAFHHFATFYLCFKVTTSPSNSLLDLHIELRIASQTSTRHKKMSGLTCSPRAEEHALLNFLSIKLPLVA